MSFKAYHVPPLKTELRLSKAIYFNGVSPGLCHCRLLTKENWPIFTNENKIIF